MDKIEFDAPPGGVMTREVGAVTGRLELHVTEARGGMAVRVSYAGALDSYRVEGSPVMGHDVDRLVARLSRDPGLDEHGNPAAVDLCGLDEQDDTD